MTRWTAASATLALCALLVVCNEVFGHPPLLTPELRLAPGMTGTWSHGAITFRISDEGTVSGRYGDLEFRGQLRRNRTRFGRWLNWRTDYIISGKLSDGRPVSVPMQWTGRSYKGSFFIGPNYEAGGPASFEATRHI